MNLYMKLIVFVLILDNIFCDKTVEIEFIENYVKKQPNLLVISAFLCWEKGDILNLTKEMNNNNYFINIKTEETLNLNNFNSAGDVLYIIDSNCNIFVPILKIANASNLFQIPNHWLILASDNLSINIFDNYQTYLNSKVILAIKTENNIFILKYIYKIRHGGIIKLDEFEKWQYGNDFTNYTDTNIWRRRRNFKGDDIKAVIIMLDSDSLNHLTDYRHPETDAGNKMNYILANFVAYFLNATLDLTVVSTWYYLKSSDQNNTALGELLMKRVDWSASTFFCKSERFYIYKCIAMTTPIFGQFIFKSPPLSYVKNIFVLPFDLKLWITDIFVLFICSILLYIIILWEWKILKETGTEPDVDMIHANFADAVLFTIGAICQQGYATEPKGNSGKILILTIFITLIFIFTAYSAYTVVLFQSTSDDIKSLEDLYNSKMTLASDDKIYLLGTLKNYTEKWRKKIYTDRLAPKNGPYNFIKVSKGIERMRNEYFAYHVDQFSGYKAISDTFLDHEKCGLKYIDFLEETKSYTVGPINNPLLTQLRIAYHRIQEVGLNVQELRRRFAGKPECTTQGNNYRSAGILDLYSVYMLLIFGLVLSLVFLLLEIFVHKFINKRTAN